MCRISELGQSGPLYIVAAASKNRGGRGWVLCLSRNTLGAFAAFVKSGRFFQLHEVTIAPLQDANISSLDGGVSGRHILPQDALQNACKIRKSLLNAFRTAMYRRRIFFIEDALEERLVIPGNSSI